MTSATDYNWITGIEHGITHNGYVEVHSLTAPPPGGAFADGGTYRCLPLATARGGRIIHVKTPGLCDLEGHYLRDGARVQAVVLTDTTRMMAEHIITGRCEVRLNAEVDVVALHLRREGEIHSAQRRAAYRVPTRGIPFHRVELLNGNGNTLTCGLTNLSASGAGVSADLYQLSDAQLGGGDLNLRLQPQDADAPLYLPANLVRVGDPTGRTVELGLAFDFTRTGGADATRERKEQLEQLRSALERAALRRRKTA